MIYVKQYKNFGSRIVNTDNSKGGIYIPAGSTIKQQLKRLQSQSNYAFKRYGFKEYSESIALLKDAIKEGFN